MSIIGMIGLFFVIPQTLSFYLMSLIYGLSNAFLFLSSGIYHAKKHQDDEESIWRKFDHIAIFIMIAGTYTPLCFLSLEGIWFWGMLLAQWLCVLFGLVFKLIILNVPRVVTISIYLIQGWMAILPVYHFWNNLAPLSMILIFAGGITYSIGAIIYQRKKPNPWPGVFGFHEIFHVFILIGAFLFYITIFRELAHLSM